MNLRGKKKYFFVFQFALLNLFLFAQTPLLRNFNTRNGLPGNEVYQVYEDKKGHIWICTDAGIARYNSGEFKLFNSSNGLPDNTIFEVKEDSKGRIWFRSFSGKTGYIFNNRIFSIEANEIIPSFIKEGIIGSFQVRENGDLILGRQGTSEISFLKISPPYTKNNVSVIRTDKKVTWGIDLFLSENGETVFSEIRGNTITTEPFRVSLFDDAGKLILADSVFDVRNNSAFSRISYNNNKLYFANSTVLKEYDLKNKKIRTLRTKTDAITVYKEKISDRIWIGLRDSFVRVLKNFSEEPETPGPETGSCTSVLQDFQGGYWFGTLEKGIFYLSDNESRLCKAIVPGRVTGTRLVDGNKLFAGCANGEVFVSYLNKNELSFRNLDLRKQNLQPGFISKIIELDTGHLIILGKQDVIVFDKRSETGKSIFKESSDGQKAFALKESTHFKNHLLFCSYKYLFVLDEGKYRIIDTVPSSDRLTTIIYYPAEKICYVGALHGLYTYKGQKEISQKDKVLDYRVEQLALCKNNLVIATKEYGLIIKNEKSFDTINTSRGLLSNICRSVKTKQDTIWVNTNLGISEIIYKGPGDYEIINYSLSKLGDFIEIDDFEIWQKKIVLRSGSDLCFFSMERKKKEDRVYITAMKVAGETMNTEKQNLFSHKVSAIRFEYEALFYWNKDKTLFRYRLNNEAGWNYTNETYVSFPGLSPGEFIFTLEAKNNEGVWVKARQSVSFSIQPPFWKTWWFILLEIFSGVILTGLLFFIRSKRILRAEKIKDRIKSDMQELQIRVMKAQMNPHFIFNSLNSIQEFILREDSDNALIYLSKFAKLIRKLIESNTAESLSLEDEMDILRKYLELESLRFGESFEFEIEKSENISTALRIPQMMVQPIVENAIWHGLLPKKGERKLKISFSERDAKTIYCRIDDNGIGRNASAKIQQGPVKHRSLALDFIKQRLYLLGQAMNADCGIKIVDKTIGTEAAGTFVEIIIPLINK